MRFSRLFVSGTLLSVFADAQSFLNVSQVPTLSSALPFSSAHMYALYACGAAVVLCGLLLARVLLAEMGFLGQVNVAWCCSTCNVAPRQIDAAHALGCGDYGFLCCLCGHRVQSAWGSKPGKPGKQPKGPIPHDASDQEESDADPASNWERYDVVFIFKNDSWW